jgi:hypothetical protein
LRFFVTPIVPGINAHFCLFGLWNSPLAAEGAVVFVKACEQSLVRVEATGQLL